MGARLEDISSRPRFSRGLKKGDIIIEIAGKEVANVRWLWRR